MTLSKIASFVLFSSSLLLAEEIELFQHPSRPEKQELRLHVDSDLVQETPRSDLLEDRPFSTIDPHVDRPGNVTSMSRAFPETHTCTHTLKYVLAKESLSLTFFSVSVDTHAKEPREQLHYSIIPWRVVKDLTSMDVHAESTPPFPGRTPAYEQQYTFFQTQSIAFIHLERGMKEVLSLKEAFELQKTPFLEKSTSIPLAVHLGQPSSYTPNKAIAQMPSPFIRATSPWEEHIMASPIETSAHFASSSFFPALETTFRFPTPSINDLPLNEPLSLGTTPNPPPLYTAHKEPTLQLVFINEPMHTLRSDEQIGDTLTATIEEKENQPIFHSLSFHCIERPEYIKFTTSQDHIAFTPTSPFFFFEKSYHAFTNLTSFAPSVDGTTQRLSYEPQLTQQGPRIEENAFYPKKMFSFAYTPSGTHKLDFSQKNADVSTIGNHVVEASQAIHRQFYAHFFVDGLDESASFIPKNELYSAYAEPSYDSRRVAYEEHLSNTPLVHTIQSANHSLRFLLDDVYGYIAQKGNAFSIKPQRGNQQTDSPFVALDPLFFEYVPTDTLSTFSTAILNDGDLLFHSTNAPIISDSGQSYSDNFPLTHEEPIAFCESNVSLFPLQIHTKSKGVLPVPTTNHISNVLFADGLHDCVAEEERADMVSFTEGLGKMVGFVFPVNETTGAMPTQAASFSIEDGLPTLKNRVHAAAYGIEQSRHVNDGYRLTSYNLTRLPTPEELNIDEYLESLEADVTVIPRNDDEGYYFSVTLRPRNEEELTKTPQNVVFILDRTSSILAPRYDSYRTGVMRALPYLQEGDTFNIVVVDEKLHFYESKPVPVSRTSIRRARRFLQDLPFPKFKRSHVDLYDLLYEVNDFFEGNGNANTAILVSDGLSLFDVDHKADTLKKILSKNQGNVTLHCAASGGKNNSAMLDLISTFHSGEFVHSHSVAAFPRKLARLVKKSNALLSKNIHVTPVTLDTTLNVNLYTTNDRMPHLYSGKPFTVYGSINQLSDFRMVFQGKVGNRYMHYEKEISFCSAQKSTPELYRFISIHKAYACYDLFLKKQDPLYLRDAKALLQKYKLPSATQRKASTNYKNLMRERLDLF